MGLSPNPSKTRVIHPDEEFTYLKTRFQLLTSGAVHKRLPSETYRRRCRHIAGLQRLVERGVLGPEDLAASEASWSSVSLRVIAG